MKMVELQEFMLPFTQNIVEYSRLLFSIDKIQNNLNPNIQINREVINISNQCFYFSLMMFEIATTRVCEFCPKSQHFR